ncbi:MAG: hypothetical protein GW893_05355 [Armatimonadetes bacterium]|nr:hypothetical protein [Armatimonadota bacterium]
MDKIPKGVIVIGLDGATLDVLIPLAKQGLMPRMGELLKKSAYGPLTSVIPPVTGPAWTTFMTGMMPDRHGLMDFVHRTEGSVHRVPVNYNRIQTPTILEMVGKQQTGKRVCGFNIPITYPAPEINGIVVSGMLTPGTDVDYTYPKELKQEIEAIEPYILDVFWQTFSDSSSEAFLRRLIEFEKQKVRISRELYEREAWDLFISVFVGTDRIQHALWPVIAGIIDAKTLEPRWEALKPLVREYFSIVDDAVGWLLDKAGDEKAIFVMSDHGFGPLDRKFYVNRWLHDQGWLAFDERMARTQRTKALVKLLLKKILLRIPGLGKIATSKMTRPMKGRMKAYQFLDIIDWDKTTAYGVSNTEQGIYINLKGREPNGIIEPGEEYQRVCKQVADALKQVVDPQDGKSIVSHAYSRDELYSGPHAGESPDIIFFLRDGAYLADVKLHPKPFGPTSWTTGRGTHRLDGTFIAYGPNVKPQSGIRTSIADLVPCILYQLGMAIPDNLDGKLPLDVFDKEFVTANPPSYRTAESSEREGKQGDMDEDEQALVFERLKGLGYL